jgi:hypothetical protein
LAFEGFPRINMEKNLEDLLSNIRKEVSKLEARLNIYGTDGAKSRRK